MYAINNFPFSFSQGIALGWNLIPMAVLCALLAKVLPWMIKRGWSFFDFTRKEAASEVDYKTMGYRFVEMLEKNGKKVSEFDIQTLEEDLSNASSERHPKIYQEWKSRINQQIIFSASTSDEDSSPLEVEKESAIRILREALENDNISLAEESEYILKIDEAQTKKEIGRILLDAGVLY